MEPKTFTDLDTFNRLGMYEFEIVSFSEKDDSLLVRAHRGYPQHFRAEITFSSVEYIACPVYFFDVRLRLATEQEIARVSSHRDTGTLYCFEDMFAAGTQQAETFFICANAVEITVYYGGDNLDEIIGHIQI